MRPVPLGQVKFDQVGQASKHKTMQRFLQLAFNDIIFLTKIARPCWTKNKKHSFRIMIEKNVFYPRI